MYERYENWEELLEQVSKEKPWVLIDTMEGGMYGGFATVADALELAAHEELDLSGEYYDSESTQELRDAQSKLDVEFFQSIWWDVVCYDDNRLVLDPDGASADPRKAWFHSQGQEMDDPRPEDSRHY